MNDHNLDDLIIDNMKPKKNSKAKSLLTIVALLIVVLIVAIILTSVILEEPKEDNTLMDENSTEMISPELTLENATKIKKPKAEPKLSEIIEEELNSPAETPKKPEAPREPETTPEKVPEVVAPKVVETVTPEPATEVPEEKSIEEEETAIEIPEIKPEPVQEEKTKPIPVPKVEKKKPAPVTHSGAFYIQVGAYRARPSKRLLSAIKSNGFNYKLTAPAANGTKKLLIGPYSSRGAANSALVRVRDRINKSAFVVKK